MQQDGIQTRHLPRHAQTGFSDKHFSWAETKEGKAGALHLIWCDRTLANGRTTISEVPVWQSA
jgi:hypothetical protein